MRKSDELEDPGSCFNRATDDELMFVLLGRDIAAPGTIRDWVTRRVSEIRYRIVSDVELPLRMQGEYSFEDGYALVCFWNDHHVVEAMAWLESVDEDGRSSDRTR